MAASPSTDTHRLLVIGSYKLGCMRAAEQPVAARCRHNTVYHRLFAVNRPVRAVSASKLMSGLYNVIVKSMAAMCMPDPATATQTAME